MKKAVAWLVLALVLCCNVALAEDVTVVGLENLITMRSAELVEDTIGVQEGEALTVASVTELAGYFSTDLWGNNTSDIDVRQLLHGYGTIAWLRSAEMMINGMSVATIDVSVDDVGNRTYTINLMTDLVYNDGTPIMAKDYIFSLLLHAAPEVAELGGRTRGLAHFVGYDEYLSGATSGVRGIRLLGDYAFSLEISAAYLPYFYGLSMLDVTPYPMHVIAPGCDILDAGDGAYIGRGSDAAGMSEAALGFVPGVFSADMLRKTMLDPDTGYVFNPQVTSGPYQLESFDKEAKVATFTINEHYLGNYEGQTAHIERIVFHAIHNDEMIDAISSGEVGLLNKVLDGDTVVSMLQLTSGTEATVNVQNYPREGFAYLALACEDGVTADVAVRQAIAHCVNKEEMVAAISPYAITVNGYYGLGQWITSYSADEDPDLEQEELDIGLVTEELAIPFDVEEAQRILTDAGWAFDAEGGAYVEGIRYRKEGDGSLTPLVVSWAKSTDSKTTDIIEEYISEPFAQAGIDLQITEMVFEEMMRHFYRIEPRTYDMFFLASNFLSVFDPYYDYNTADFYQGAVNTSGLKDEHLQYLAMEMRTTPPMEMYEYAQKWVAFQEYWVEVMPLVPLYSNVYFDFFRNDLQDYDVTLSNTWSSAIPYAWIGEPVEVEVTEGDDGGFIIVDGM